MNAYTYNRQKKHILGTRKDDYTHQSGLFVGIFMGIPPDGWIALLQIFPIDKESTKTRKYCINFISISKYLKANFPPKIGYTSIWFPKEIKWCVK